MNSVGNQTRSLTKVLLIAAVAMFVLGQLLMRPFGHQVISFTGAERIGNLTVAIAFAAIGWGFWLERRSKLLTGIFALFALSNLVDVFW